MSHNPPSCVPPLYWHTLGEVGPNEMVSVCAFPGYTLNLDMNSAFDSFNTGQYLPVRSVGQLIATLLAILKKSLYSAKVSWVNGRMNDHTIPFTHLLVRRLITRPSLVTNVPTV